MASWPPFRLQRYNFFLIFANFFQKKSQNVAKIIIFTVIHYVKDRIFAVYCPAGHIVFINLFFCVQDDSQHDYTGTDDVIQRDCFAKNGKCQQHHKDQACAFEHVGGT